MSDNLHVERKRFTITRATIQKIFEILPEGQTMQMRTVRAPRGGMSELPQTGVVEARK